MKYTKIAALVACTSLCAPSFLVVAEKTKKNLNENNNKFKKIETITVLGASNTEGATLGGTNLKELPINTHVVGQAELERLSFVDPNEFLDRIPGETQVRNLRIPDGGKGYTIPMLDGMPLENPYEGATQRLDRVNTFDIQRVEVIKGPASALYPNNAFGGIVNVISKDAPLKPETTVFIEAGDFNRLRAGVNTGGSVDNIDYFFDANIRNLGGLRDGVINDKEQFSGKLSFALSDYTKLTTRFEYLDELAVLRADLTEEELEENPTQAEDLSSADDIQQSTFSLKAEHTLDSGLLNFDLVLREKDTSGDSRFGDPSEENDLAHSAKASYQHDFDDSNIIVGFDTYRSTNDVIEYEGYDEEIHKVTGDIIAEYSEDLTIDAYFLQYHVNATDKLTVTAGLRYEDITVESTEANTNGKANFSDLAPKLGLTYQLNDNNMLWLGVSDGFYVPSTGNLFDVDDGNQDLKPEEARNIEVGLRGQTGAWHYDTSLYYNDITNYLVTQELFRTVNGIEEEFELTTNAGQVSIKGIETVIEYAPKNSVWRLGLTHTFTDNTYDTFIQSTVNSDDDLSGKTLRRSPDHHLNARIAWTPTSKLTLELEGDFYSEYFADNENSDESRFTRGERINLRADYHVNNWRLWIHALNLTDTQEDRATFSRGTMSFRTIDGRTFYAGASYTF